MAAKSSPSSSLVKITKIISGGQTGVDQAALHAAQSLQLETGGYMPKGFKTEDGPQPHLKDLFGMIEMSSSDYPTRTRKNVEVSDGTLIFCLGSDGLSPGTRLTINSCKYARKPYVLILDRNIETDIEKEKTKILIWKFFEDNHISVLNVAGSRKKEYYDKVFNFICFLFSSSKKGVTVL